MGNYLKQLAERVGNDPAARREMALWRGAGARPDYSALSIIRHQVEMLEKHGVAIDFDPVTGLKGDGTSYGEDEPLQKRQVGAEEARRRIARLRWTERLCAESSAMDDGLSEVAEPTRPFGA